MPKLYWSDLGIARHLSGSWGPTTGPLFETLVVAETVKLIRTLGLEAEAFFYRTRSGLEVDLLITTPAGIVCAEIKSRDTAAAADLRAMRSLARALGQPNQHEPAITLENLDRLAPPTTPRSAPCVRPRCAGARPRWRR